MTAAKEQTPLSEFDVYKIRQDFPQVANTKVHGKPLIYLDSAASTLKVLPVIETVSKHYTYEASNIHRGVHFLSEQGTTQYENTRVKMRDFLSAKHKEEIIFTKGTTESINLVARTYGEATLKKGDEIILSEMEHHSNIVPWQILCEKVGATIKVIPVNDDGELIMEEYEKLLSEKTKIVSVVYISNSLGTINPVKDIIEKAHKHNAVVLIDAAQAAAHQAIDVQDLDCDFLALSGHKMFGPTGVGILYGKKDILNAMPPFLGGGDMIDKVTFEKTTYNDLPHKFEAGTPNIASVIGLAPAIDYINKIGLSKIAAHENEILQYATAEIKKIDGVRLIGAAKNKSSVLSFVIDGCHPQDVGTLIDMEGIAIRTGHHCTQPLMERFQVSATCRASFSIYNTKEDVDVFVTALKKVKGML